MSHTPDKKMGELWRMAKAPRPNDRRTGERMTTRTEVVGSYEEALQSAIDTAARIHTTLQAQMDNINIQRVNWGTVGSARHIAGELREVSDQLHREGEYSPRAWTAEDILRNEG